MNKQLNKFEAAMMAVAFAETGEFETARQILIEEEQTDERPDLQTRITEGKTFRSD